MGIKEYNQFAYERMLGTQGFRGGTIACEVSFQKTQSMTPPPPIPSQVPLGPVAAYQSHHQVAQSTEHWSDYASGSGGSPGPVGRFLMAAEEAAIRATFHLVKWAFYAVFLAISALLSVGLLLMICGSIYKAIMH